MNTISTPSRVTYLHDPTQHRRSHRLLNAARSFLRRLQSLWDARQRGAVRHSTERECNIGRPMLIRLRALFMKHATNKQQNDRDGLLVASAVLAAFVIGIVSAMLITGCATIRPIAQVNLPLAQTEAQIAGGLALKYAVSDADREDIANMVYYAGDVMADWSGGVVPTSAQFRAFLEAEGIGKLAKYQPIIEQLVAVYTAKVPLLVNDAKLANDYIHALAVGAKLAAKPYVHDPSI